MKRIAIVAASLALSCCGPTDDGPRGSEGRPEVVGTATPEEKPDAGATRKAGEAAAAAEGDRVTEEDPRQALLEEEWELYADEVISHDASALPDEEKVMLRHLLNAARIVEELHMLQLNPKNLEWRDRIMKGGTELEKKIFSRFQSPWCADNESPDCCALAEKPPREIGAMHWPEDMTEEEYESLGRQINGKELLSPFTVVDRGDSGKLEAIPYSRTEILGPRMKALSEELREASRHTSEKSLERFLVARADALISDDPYPYDSSDYEWIALKGDWEVTVGPYETYKNPRQLKALFEMYVGREDEKITGELARFKDNLQDMEDSLAKLVGPEIYKSRKLDKRISIRAVDIWMASGDGRRDRGATVAFHLPNRGRSVDDGLYKKVMMVNHSLAFEPVTRARAGQILDPGQLGLVDAQADIKNVTFHEFSHGFGAYHEMKVTNPKGKETTVKEALKEFDSLMEEEKADTFGLWLLSFEKAKGWVDEEQEKMRYTSAIMHALGLLQYPLSGTYPRMVAIQLGWYLDRGGITWDEEEGRFTVHFDKMPAAVESLAKKVATIQLTGDYAQARELVETYIEKKGEGEYALKGPLAQARKVMMDKFAAAGIKSPSLRYEVTGL